MNGHLSTHALDLYRGKPADGLRLSLYFLNKNGTSCFLKEKITNIDGRTTDFLLDSCKMRAGNYELVFEIGEYFARLHVPVSEPPFLNQIPIRFSIADIDCAYHVPLLFSPWSYSTYRGS